LTFQELLTAENCVFGDFGGTIEQGFALHPTKKLFGKSFLDFQKLLTAETSGFG
jgi:hypothetical protein